MDKNKTRCSNSEFGVLINILTVILAQNPSNDKEENTLEVKMDREEFMEELMKNGEYDCSCHINPPCSFCVDGVDELYEEYLEEGEQQ